MASFTYYGGGCVCSRDKCSDDCKTYRNYKPKPVTNADRIRAMTDEQLAGEFNWVETQGRIFGPRGKSAWLDWLRQEAST